MRDRLIANMHRIGLDSYEVGGCIRDELLGKQAKDVDFVVCGVDYDELERVLAAEGIVAPNTVGGRLVGCRLLADWTPPEGLFDLAFIDGDHANVAKDWEKFEPLVRPGGILLLHDYIGPQSQGPRTLVDEVIRPQWQRWECATLPYSYGLTIVRKR